MSFSVRPRQRGWNCKVVGTMRGVIVMVGISGEECGYREWGCGLGNDSPRSTCQDSNPEC